MVEAEATRYLQQQKQEESLFIDSNIYIKFSFLVSYWQFHIDIFEKSSIFPNSTIYIIQMQVGRRYLRIQYLNGWIHLNISLIGTYTYIFK